MTRELSRRRLLASTGVLASSAVLGAVGTAGAAAGDAFDDPPVRWSQTYGNGYLNTGASITEHDGQYVVAGTTGDQQSRTGWLFAIDATSGAGQWGTTFRNDDLDAQPGFAGVAPAHDGGFVLLGTSATGTVSLVKTTADGETDWWQTFQVAGDTDQARLLLQDVIPFADGYALPGLRVEGQSANAVVLVVDETGTEQSRARYFEDQRSGIFGAIPDGNGGLVGTGVVGDPVTGSEPPPLRGLLFSLGSGGGVQWSQEYVATFEGDQGNSLLQTVVDTGDGYVGVGNVQQRSTESTTFEGWAVSADASGAELENQRLAPQPVTNLVAAAPGTDGVVVAGGVSSSLQSQTSSGVVAELDASLEPLWARTLGPADANNFQDVIATDDGGIAATGPAQNNEQGADPVSEAWVGKLGGAGATSTPTPTSTPAGGETASPTPTETPSPTPTETSSPTPTVTPSPTPTPTETETPSPTPTQSPTTTTDSGDGPGFGVGSAIAALGAGALLRRSDLFGDDE